MAVPPHSNPQAASPLAAGGGGGWEWWRWGEGPVGRRADPGTISVPCINLSERANIA